MQGIMKHFAENSFWNCYHKLPASIQKLADKNFHLLKLDPKHPSLHFKKIVDNLWSVRAAKGYRALAFKMDDGHLVWFWIGKHAQYDKLIK